MPHTYQELPSKSSLRASASEPLSDPFIFAAAEKEESVGEEPTQIDLRALIQINDSRSESEVIAVSDTQTARHVLSAAPRMEPKQLMSQNVKYSVSLGQFSLVSFD